MNRTAQNVPHLPASIALAGKVLQSRFGSALPVRPRAGVDVEVDVTVTGDDLITVEQTVEGTALNLFILSEVTSYGATDPVYIIEQIKGHNPDQINIYIGSLGGDLITAFKYYDVLRSSRANVTAYLTGVCASAATIIACAADEVVMSRQCMYMVHQGSIHMGYTNKKEVEANTQILRASDETMIDVYARRTGLPKDEVTAMVEQETWLTADAALELGFVDRVVEDIILNLELPGDVRSYYDSCYDLGWWGSDAAIGFYDTKTGAVRPEKDVFASVMASAKKAKNGRLISSRAELSSTDQTAPNKEAKTTDMKFIDAIVSALTKGGYVPNDQSAAAANELKAGGKDILAMLVEEVKEHLAEQAPPETDPAPAAAPSLAEQIAALTDEEKASIREALELDEADEADLADAQPNPVVEEVAVLSRKLTEVTNALSALRAGRTAPAAPASNGGGDITPPAEPAGEPVGSALYKFALNSYKQGNMDAATFTKTTGHAAPPVR